MSSEGEFPLLRAWARLGVKGAASVYDVKFYPYTKPEEDAVFAACCGCDIIIGRPGATKDFALDVLKVIRHPDENASLNSLAWSQDLLTREPLICAGGSGSKHIHIFNAISGTKVRTFHGHGSDVNDLQISPISPEILASCSGDYSIRLWSLDPAHSKQPCAAILSLEGHRTPILTLAFHSNGKYILSGGQDSMICLWAVPEVSEKNAGTDKPTIVPAPHFASIDVHSDYVDCIEFYGDLILSRACGGDPGGVNKKDSTSDPYRRNDILLWKIDGFSSHAPTPREPPVPQYGKYTRSAFGNGFQRLLTFEMVSASPFYMRFGLFNQPGHHPMLAMGNLYAKYYFWDLQRLEGGEQADEQQPRGRKTAQAKRRGGSRDVDSTATGFWRSQRSRDRENGKIRDGSRGREGSAARTNESNSGLSDHKLLATDPMKPIPAHAKLTVDCNVNFACRQVAWSNCGKWCIGVGDLGMIALFKRWD